MAQIDGLLKILKDKGGSDLHLSPGNPPLFRISGDLEPLETGPLTHDQISAVLIEIMNDDQKAEFATKRDLDFAYEVPAIESRFRANYFFGRQGMGGVFRIIPTKIKSLKDLNLPDAITRFTQLKKGLVVVTGATGSGKSTTLAAMVDYINQTRQDHILTIEDPIEFVHRSQKSLVNQREVGNHTKSFAAALRASLREDPDVILIGEMRDLETIELALTAAETGHLVFGTLHTNSAAKTVDRIINVFPTNQQAQIRTMLSESLAGVVAQNLLKSTDGKRVAAVEILVVNSAVANLIREAKTFQLPSIIQTGKRDGMLAMDQAVKNLIESGRVTAAEGARFLSRGSNEMSSSGTGASVGAMQS